MARDQGFKRKKMEEKILSDLNLFLRNKSNDPIFQMASITKVELNHDFSVASVYWDSFNAEIKSELGSKFKSIKGTLRSVLAKTLEIRVTPIINLIEDKSYDAEKFISDILSEEVKKGKSF